MTIIPKRESLRTRARKKARNIGVSDRRRRAAAPQSLFGALLEYLSQSPREMEKQHNIPKSILYRYVRGEWRRQPFPHIRDRVLLWFYKETRRTLDLMGLRVLVQTMTEQDPVARRKQVTDFLGALPVVPQDRPMVQEITPPPRWEEVRP